MLSAPGKVLLVAPSGEHLHNSRRKKWQTVFALELSDSIHTDSKTTGVNC